jgi:HKD family nuclease
MIKVSKEFIDDAEPYLNKAIEVWVAVALVKEDALARFQSLISKNAKQHYLIGIDLPTLPKVLRIFQKLCSKKIDAAICKSSYSFHPKVYLIETAEETISFIGSSNLTKGGLQENTEMNVAIEDKTIFQSLRTWFELLKQESYPLTDENINEYESKFNSVSEHNDLVKKAFKSIRLTKLDKSNKNLANIDFSDRFFKKEHHLAFRSSLWEDDSPSANKERNAVKSRFLELHNMIFAKFGEYGLFDIHPNIKNHIVSMDYHFPGQTSQRLNAMWLSYGKSAQEIKLYHELLNGRYRIPHSSKDEEDDKQSFINHSRLQVRIELAEIGIWILFGKNNNGGLFDRQHFERQMKNQEYRSDLFSLLFGLPSEYWVEVRGVTKHLKEFDTSEAFHHFCAKDRPEDYFIIGRNYGITDREMSEEALPTTVLTEFKRLYPIYSMMRDKRFSL